MKKVSLISGMLTVVLFAGILFVTSCGKEGPAGADGTDGVDGNVVCMKCHTLDNKANIHMQYEQSQHHEGEFVAYAGSRQDCAKCHSHEGFVETTFTGADTTLSPDGIPYPTKITCTTCHSSHSTFDFENDGDDYALRTNEPIQLIADNTYTLDFEGSSNLCAVCHEPRRIGPKADANDSFRVTSPYWGPHHGPQSTFLEGVNGYEIAGSMTYPAPKSSEHRTGASCVSCHMSEYDNGKGGHTWWPALNACTTCHEDATSFDYNGVQTQVQGLMAQLETILKNEGILDNDGHMVPGTYHIDLAGAAYNYLGVYDDRSDGIHNPDYIIALLTNSLEAVQ